MRHRRVGLKRLIPSSSTTIAFRKAGISRPGNSLNFSFLIYERRSNRCAGPAQTERLRVPTQRSPLKRATDPMMEVHYALAGHESGGKQPLSWGLSDGAFPSRTHRRFIMPTSLSRREILAGAGFAAGATVLRAAS